MLYVESIITTEQVSQRMAERMHGSVGYVDDGLSPLVLGRGVGL